MFCQKVDLSKIMVSFETAARGIQLHVGNTLVLKYFKAS